MIIVYQQHVCWIVGDICCEYVGHLIDANLFYEQSDHMIIQGKKMIKLFFYEKVKTFKENTEAQQPFFKVEIISKRCVEIVVDPKMR